MAHKLKSIAFCKLTLQARVAAERQPALFRVLSVFGQNIDDDDLTAMITDENIDWERADVQIGSTNTGPQWLKGVLVIPCLASKTGTGYKAVRRKKRACHRSPKTTFDRG